MLRGADLPGQLRRLAEQAQGRPAVQGHARPWCSSIDIGTRLMVDLKVATPVQDFIDKEKYDISDLEPNVLAYYTVDGKQ